MSFILLVLGALFSTRSCSSCFVEFADLQMDGRETGTFFHPLQSHKVSWKFVTTDDEVRDVRQVAYHIRVYCSETEIFDSGKIESDVNSNHYLDGIKLDWSSSCKWNVVAWVNKCQESIESNYFEFFTTVDDGLWEKSEFLTGGNLFRTEFTLPSNFAQDGVDRAFLFITGLGYYKSFMNGHAVGDRILDPTWTNYNYTVLYSAYDITSLLSATTSNAIGIMVGNGWYAHTSESSYYGKHALKGLRAIIQLFSSTSSEINYFSFSKNWKTTSGPIIYDSIYNGETYDANLEQQGWTEPYFKNDSSWAIPQSSPGPPGKLKLQTRPPVRDSQIFLPISIKEPKPGLYIIDFGQNFAGVCELSVTGNVGVVTITLRHAEIINSDGTLYTTNLRSAKATDRYITSIPRSSQKNQTYRPTFTSHGFRYVSVEGIEKTQFSIRGIHFHTSVPRTGSLSFLTTHSKKKKNSGESDATSSPHWFSLLQSSILYSQQSNLMGIPTDCPQRDERLGWLADAFLSSIESSYNYGMLNFFLSHMGEFVTQLRHQPDFADIVPYVNRFSTSQEMGDPTWTAALWFLVDLLYERYGNDVRVLGTFYDVLGSYMTFLDGKVRGTSLDNFWNAKYGDWCPPPPRKDTIKSYSASWYWVSGLERMEEWAALLGKHEDKKKWKEWVLYYRTEFLKAFFKRTEGRMKLLDNSQSAVSMGLRMEIFPSEEERGKFVKLLISDITERGFHVTTGIVGTFHIFPTLCDVEKIGGNGGGYFDVAVAMASRTAYPSYGYMFFNEFEPSTTIWELWDAPQGDPGMDSRNHIMFGSVGGWLYEQLVGIEVTGKKGVVIAPIVSRQANVPNVVGGKYDSVYGLIEVETEHLFTTFCGIFDEKSEFLVKCPEGLVVTNVTFASFGLPKGRCAVGQKFEVDPLCHAKDSLEVTKKACIGKSSCEIYVDKKTFSEFICIFPDHIKKSKNRINETKRFYVKGMCGNNNDNNGVMDVQLTMKVTVPVNVKNGYAVVKVPIYTLKNKNDYEIEESKIVVWKNGKMVKPKKEGILDIYMSKFENFVIFNVTSGKFSFVLNSPTDGKIGRL